MNRFRRKSESGRRRKGKEDEERASSALSDEGANVESGAGPTLGLPEFGDFRQSLILPGLARRFSLLRSEDGQLVDKQTFESHLAQQRQTGFMSAGEADALLAQYHLQSQYESVQPDAPRPKRERIDWRTFDADHTGEGPAGSFRGDAASFRTSFTTTSEDHTSSSLATTRQNSLLSPSTTAAFTPSSPASFLSLAGSSSAAAQQSASAPDMSRESSASGSGSSATTYPYQYRRGANSLFGGRWLAARDMKIIKSGSTNSIVSLTRSEKGKGVEAPEDEAIPPAVEDSLVLGALSSASLSPAASPQLSVQSVGGAEQLDASASEGSPHFVSRGPATADESPSPPLGRALLLEEAGASPPPRESASQPPMVGYEEDRSNGVEPDGHADEHRRGAAEESHMDPTSPISPITDSDLRGLTTFDASSPTLDAFPYDPPSPAVSDTEPVDPFYQRMDAPPMRAPPSPPSIEQARQSVTSPEPLDEDGLRPPSVSLPPLTAPPSTVPPTIPPSYSVSSGLDLLATGPPARDSPSPRPSITIPARPARLRELSLETDDDSGETPSTAADSPSSPPLPAVYSFPVVPSRSTGASTERKCTTDLGEPEAQSKLRDGSILIEDADETLSDRPPFDLSLGEGHVTVDAERGAVEDGAASASHQSMLSDDERVNGASDAARTARPPPDIGAGERESTITLDSLGSSFHEAHDGPDSDADILPHDPSITTSPASSALARYHSATSRPHSLGVALPSSSSPTPDAADSLRPTSFPLERQASNELHQVLASAFAGENTAGQADTSDLILQDLLLIQEKLVQSAARRAASQNLATPSTMASDEGSDLASPLAPTSPLSIRKRVPPPPIEEPSSPARKLDSAESSSSKSDLGGALAGLGLMSLSPSDLVSSSLQQQSRPMSSGMRSSTDRQTSEHPRASRTEEADDERDSTLFGPASTQMTFQTSQTSSTSPFTNSAVTPSTTQSDAFEFSSLVASPERGSWEDAQEHLREESGSVRTRSSPHMDDSSSPLAGDDFDDDAAHGTVTRPIEPDHGDGAADQSSPMQHARASSSTTASPALGEAAPIDTESFLRVPRNMPRRDPSTTTSMLIRDVRNQATLATIALKKQSPVSPPTKPLNKSRSVRKLSISCPQLVSGPINIPAVPIAPQQSPEPSRFGRSRSKSRKKKDEGGKAEGLGLRFKMLLKKPHSRDQLGHLNGDEVTPFVDPPAEERRPRISGIPITPPNQSVAQFESPSSQISQSSNGSEPTPRQARSPAYRPSSGLRTLGEAAEHSSTASDSPQTPSTRKSDVSSHSRTLSRDSPRQAPQPTRRRGSSGASRISARERPPTPPPAIEHRRQASVASREEAGPVPPVPAAMAPPRVLTALVPPVPVAGPSSLFVPPSPSLGSLASRKSSEYAGSFIDFYADNGEDDEEDEPGDHPFGEDALAQAYEGFDSLRASHGRRPSLAPSVDEQLAQQHEQELTARLRPVTEFEEHPEYGNAFGPARDVSPALATTDDEVVAPSLGVADDGFVWQVLNDLRNNRASVISKDSSFGFSSRDSSFALDEEPSGGDRTNAIAGMLCHRNRQRSSAGSLMPSEWDGRFPSIYFREEQALIQLGEQGGVAPEAEGRFLVRPKEPEPEVPPVPEEYRGQQTAWSRG